LSFGIDSEVNRRVFPDGNNRPHLRSIFVILGNKGTQVRTSRSLGHSLAQLRCLGSLCLQNPINE
jgi:hypothetical protein